MNNGFTSTINEEKPKGPSPPLPLPSTAAVHSCYSKIGLAPAGRLEAQTERPAGAPRSMWVDPAPKQELC